MAGIRTNKEDVQRRLRRIEGQVRGLQRMVDDDAYCIDVLTQISAATKALQAVALELLDDHLSTASPTRSARAARRRRQDRRSVGGDRAPRPFVTPVDRRVTCSRSSASPTSATACARRSSCSGRRSGRWSSASRCRARCRPSCRRTRCNACWAITGPRRSRARRASAWCRRAARTPRRRWRSRCSRRAPTSSSAMVFMFASTNLVVELGIVLFVLMGWQFAAAEFVGGSIMIVLLGAHRPRSCCAAASRNGRVLAPSGRAPGGEHRAARGHRARTPGRWSTRPATRWPTSRCCGGARDRLRRRRLLDRARADARVERRVPGGPRLLDEPRERVRRPVHRVHQLRVLDRQRADGGRAVARRHQLRRRDQLHLRRPHHAAVAAHLPQVLRHPAHAAAVRVVLRGDGGRGPDRRGAVRLAGAIPTSRARDDRRRRTSSGTTRRSSTSCSSRCSRCCTGCTGTRPRSGGDGRTRSTRCARCRSRRPTRPRTRWATAGTCGSAPTGAASASWPARVAERREGEAANDPVFVTLPAVTGAAGAGSFRYRPGLDGLRALAVAAVILYHGQVSWAKGGFLGVDVFFVLSGFLITSLLLAEHERTGGDRPRVVLDAPGPPPAPRAVPRAGRRSRSTPSCGRSRPSSRRLRGDGLASLLYVSNWKFIADGHVVLPGVPGAVAARAHVVARDRGAVVPVLAARVAR